MSAMQQEELTVETLEVLGRPYFVSIEPCLSVVEAAAYARVTTKTIYRAAEEGVLASGKARTSAASTGARLVFRKSDLDDWLFGDPAQPPQPKPRRRNVNAVLEPVPVDPRSRRPRTAQS